MFLYKFTTNTLYSIVFFFQENEMETKNVAPLSIASKTVCIVGLGYVGYPLAEAFSRHIKTMGFDIDEQKIRKLQENPSSITVTSDPTQIRHADFIMICVPTLQIGRAHV